FAQRLEQIEHVDSGPDLGHLTITTRADEVDFAHVDDQAILDERGVGLVAMAAAPDPHRDAVLASPTDGMGDVLRVLTVDDRPGLVRIVVRPAGKTVPGAVPAGISRMENPAGQFR